MDFLDLQLESFADNDKMLLQIKKDLAALMPPKQRSKPNPSAIKTTKRERNSDIGPIRRNPSRSSRRFSYLDSSPPRTRSNSLSSSSSASSSPSNRMVVKFGFYSRGSEYNEDTDSEAEEEEETRRKRRTNSHFKVSKRDERSADEITDDDLMMVADKAQGKIYDKTHGSTCHQCRQKTVDMKTICRSGFCIGIQGQFCGPCLINRYGQDVRIALKDPNWKCPPCRKICNCSICRNRKGKACTGIMIHLARECGFSNVSDYLQSLRTRAAEKENSSDEDEPKTDQDETVKEQEEMDTDQQASETDQKESEVEEKESEVKEKESEVDEKESEVNEKESEFEEKGSEVDEKGSEFKETGSEVDEKESEVDEKEPVTEKQDTVTDE